MSPLKRLASCAVIVAVAAGAGCAGGDHLSPNDVHPQAMADGMSAVTSQFANNAAFQSLASLSNFFHLSAASAALRASLPLEGSPGEPRALATSVRSRLEAGRLLAALRAASAPQVLFPQNVQGKTFVWDPQTHGYVQSTRTGAPAAGVRFILYVANDSGPIGATPQELGYVDLDDQSTPQADVLAILLKLGTTTVLDYTVTAEFPTQSSIVLTASGRLTNPTNTSAFVDFTLEQSGSTAGTAGVNYHVHGSNGFTIDYQISYTQAGFSLNFALSDGHNTLALVGTIAFGVTTDTINAQLEYNGTVVATITGTTDNPTITGANGHEIPAADLAFLGQIYSAAGEILSQLGAVFQPAVLVFGGF